MLTDRGGSSLFWAALLCLVSPATTAQAGAEASPDPVVFDMADVRKGDAAMYVQTTWRVSGNLVELVEPALPSLAAEVLGDAWVADAQAQWRLARTWWVNETWPSPEGKAVGAGPRLDHRAGSELVAATRSAGSFVFGGGAPTAQEQWSYRPAARSPAPCVLQNAWQGQRVALEGDLVPWPDGCVGEAWGHGPDVATFDGVVPWGDTEAVALRTPNAVAYFGPGVPFALRMVEVTQALGSGHTVDPDVGAFLVVQDLVAFRRGEAEASAPPRPSPLALPVPRPWDELASLDSGSLVRFGLSAALDAAQAEPVVQSFRARHPAAYLQEAAFANTTDHRAMATGVVRRTDAATWELVFTDGAGTLGIQVTRTSSRIVAPPGTAGAWTDPSASEATHVQTVETHDEPRPARPPATVPDPAATAALLRALDPIGGALEAWGFEHACEDAACTVPSLRLWAGREWHASHDPILGPEGASVWRSDRVTVEGGRLADVTRLAFTWAGKGSLLEGPVGLPTVPLLGEPTVAFLQSFRERGGGAPAGTEPQPLEEVPPVGRSAAPETGTPAKAAAAGAPLAGMEAAAATVGVGAGLGALVYLAVSLFTRVRRDQALDHAARALLLEIVESSPGLHLREVVRRSGHAQGTVRHHLAKLVAVGLIEERAAFGFTCYHPAGGKRSAAVALNSYGARAVLDAIGQRATATEVARRTGLSDATVRYHLGRLRTARLVEQVPGRPLAWRRTPVQ